MSCTTISILTCTSRSTAVHTVLPCSMCPGITCGWRGLAPVTPSRLECQHVSWLLDLRAPAPAGLPPRHITLLAGECSSISRISSRHSPPLQQSAAESCSSSDCQACLGSCAGCDQCGPVCPHDRWPGLEGCPRCGVAAPGAAAGRLSGWSVAGRCWVISARRRIPHQLYTLCTLGRVREHCLNTSFARPFQKNIE